MTEQATRGAAASTVASGMPAQDWRAACDQFLAVCQSALAAGCPPAYIERARGIVIANARTALATPPHARQARAEHRHSAGAASAPRFGNSSRRELIGDHALSCLASGVECVIADLREVDPDRTISLAAADSQSRLLDSGRYYMHRGWDLEEFAACVEGVAYQVSVLRERLREGRESLIFARGTPAAERAREKRRQRALGRQYTEAFGDPRTKIEALARSLAARWVPAANNIVNRLPVPVRRQKCSALEARARDLLETLGKLATLCSDASDEFDRWELAGYGALDHAVLECVALIAYTMEAAADMDLDDPLASLILARGRLAQQRLYETLRQTASDRRRALELGNWQRRKADVLRHGVEHGGVAPQLAAVFLPRKSHVASEW